MFFNSHMIVAIIPISARQRTKVEFEGLCEKDFVKCRIPCSFETANRWVGPKEKRVEVEGSISVIQANVTKEYLVLGAMLVLKHKPGVVWQIERIEENDGVFLNNGTLDLLLSRFGVPVPPTGDLRKYLGDFTV